MRRHARPPIKEDGYERRRASGDDQQDCEKLVVPPVEELLGNRKAGANHHRGQGGDRRRQSAQVWRDAWSAVRSAYARPPPTSRPESAPSRPLCSAFFVALSGSMAVPAA